jgi:hypothetical protein
MRVPFVAEYKYSLLLPVKILFLSAEIIPTGEVLFRGHVIATDTPHKSDAYGLGNKIGYREDSLEHWWLTEVTEEEVTALLLANVFNG